MDYLRALFRLSVSLADYTFDKLPDPSSRLGVGPPNLIGNRSLPNYLLVGSERQFHRWRKRICDMLVGNFLNFQGRSIWGRQDLRSMEDIMGQFFRRDENNPALIWTSPVWIRIANIALRLKYNQENQTLVIRRHELGASHQILINAKFDGGGTFGFDASRFRFHYPGDRRSILLVPRTRAIYDSNGELVSFDYEESIHIGNPDEEVTMRRGIYTAHDQFHCEEKREQGAVKYLDLCTITLARVIPLKPRFPSMFEAMLSERSPRTIRSRRPRSADRRLPRRARVQYLRLTFEPSKLELMVPLFAERSLERFVLEHESLATLLAQAAVFGGLR